MIKVKYCKHAIDGAVATKRGSRILIQGEKLLRDKNDPVYKQVDIKLPITQVIGLQENFMYKVEQIDNAHNILQTETGIAQIWEVEEGHELLRLKRTDKKRPANMYKPETYLRISTCMPTKVSDFETPGNTVLIFNEDESITSLPLEPNTFLGRFLEEDVRAVPAYELLQIIPYADILDYIQKQEAQLKLNTRRLDLTNENATVSASILRVTPDTYSDTNRPTPQQGMIIYNQDTQTLEYYDGETWRSLVFV